MKKLIEGYPNYLIYESGRIKNIKTGRFLKPVKKKTGYRNIDLCNGSVKTFQIHRLVAETFIENPENKPYVNHKDGRKSNNKKSNLEWATQSENIKHAWDNGLFKKSKNKKL